VKRIAKKATRTISEATIWRRYTMIRCGNASSHLTKIFQRDRLSGYSTSKRAG
jgi:hypothetical protein